MGGSASIEEIKKEEFKDVALRAHNKYRLNHNSPPLKYSKDLSMFAQNHALYLRTKSKLHRSGRYCQGEFVGENIAEKYLSSSVKEYGGEEVTKDWYDEIEQYSFFEGDPPTAMKNKCRNFTQLIWKETTEVGFGIAVKGRRAIIVACYKPTGNLKGKYAENVLPEIIKKPPDRRFSKCLEPHVEE